MAIIAGKIVVGEQTVAETPPSPTKKLVKSKDEIRKQALKRMNTDARLRDPRHLTIDDLDDTAANRKVSQYMLDMYDSNELISFDK